MSENGSKVTEAHLLAELVHRIGKRVWTKTSNALYVTLLRAQELEAEDRKEQEAETKAREEAAKAKAEAAAKPLPCPWCGTQVESFDKLHCNIICGSFRYVCNKCKMVGPEQVDEKLAQIAWNTRNGKPQDRRQGGERRVASKEERLRYDQEAPWSLLRRAKQRRAANRT